MADEHFFPVGDFPSGLGAAPFFGSGPYAPPVPPPGLESLDAAACAAAMAPFGMLPWASEHPIPTDSAATATAHFDSALSSLVTSPAHAGCFGDDDDVAIGDLIGRLGSICNNAAASANNSCYSTPLSSPPRGASSPAGLAFRQGGHFHYPGPGAPPLEGAGGRLSRVASSKSLGGGAAPASENVADAETNPAVPAKGDGAARKRKAATAGKGKARTAAGNGSGSPKRPKVTGDGDTDDVAAGDAEQDTKPKPEPAKDYIHVRARRGQATDSHSLAERVRREKISERMKLLQSLVPGCNKITGKALMLDEIINYVQSLQRQVEFLSMKLSTMNPELDIDAQFLPASDNDAVTMHHHQTVPLGYPDQQDPFAGAAAVHPAMLDPCTTGSAFYHGAGAGFGGWDAAQDELIQSAVHNQHHRHHQDQDQQHPDRGHGFHGT